MFGGGSSAPTPPPSPPPPPPTPTQTAEQTTDEMKRFRKKKGRRSTFLTESGVDQTELSTTLGSATTNSVPSGMGEKLGG